MHDSLWFPISLIVYSTNQALAITWSFLLSDYIGIWKKKNTLLDQNYTWKHDLLLCKNKIFIPKTSQLREHFTLYISSFISRGWCMLICPNNSSSQVWVEMFIAMSNAAWFVNRQRIQTPTLEAYYSHYQYRNAFWKISPCILSLVCHHLKVIRLSLLLLIACPWTFHSLETGLQ